jgi:hypothetical protein
VVAVTIDHQTASPKSATWVSGACRSASRMARLETSRIIPVTVTT